MKKENSLPEFGASVRSGARNAPAGEVPLSRFCERLRTKTADYKSSGPIVIVAFGDSITMGTTTSGVFIPEDVYHNRLKKMIEQKFPGPAGGTISVINSGIGGETAKGALTRLDRDVIRYQPDLVLVAFGANDLGLKPAQKSYEASLRQIIREIREKTPADIILLTPPFMASRDNGSIPESRKSTLKSLMRFQNGGLVSKFAGIVRLVGLDEHVPVADVYAEWESLAGSGVDTTAKLANGLNHPAPEMHDIPARKIFEIIEASFNAKPGRD